MEHGKSEMTNGLNNRIGGRHEKVLLRDFRRNYPLFSFTQGADQHG